jgi:hypothetical protein
MGIGRKTRFSPENQLGRRHFKAQCSFARQTEWAAVLLASMSLLLTKLEPRARDLLEEIQEQSIPLL